jgi:hypothetical protein
MVPDDMSVYWQMLATELDVGEEAVRPLRPRADSTKDAGMEEQGTGPPEAPPAVEPVGAAVDVPPDDGVVALWHPARKMSAGMPIRMDLVTFTGDEIRVRQ